jgi:hypothetical protein
MLSRPSLLARLLPFCSSTVPHHGRFTCARGVDRSEFDSVIYTYILNYCFMVQRHDTSR